MRAKQADDIAKNLEAEGAAEAGTQNTGQVEVEFKITPPPKFVHTIRELIYWEYAKLIARAAHMENNYGFITGTFKKLRDGKMHMSEIENDDRKQMKREPKCEYCDIKDVPLTQDHIIPLIKGGPDIPSNVVLACKECNSSKGDRDIFEWYYLVKKQTEIPKLVWSKYLKLVWNFHVAYRTLDNSDVNHDGTLNIMDLGAIFRKYER